jgi:hypothetical protein
MMKKMLRAAIIAFSAGTLFSCALPGDPKFINGTWKIEYTVDWNSTHGTCVVETSCYDDVDGWFNGKLISATLDSKEIPLYGETPGLGGTFNDGVLNLCIYYDCYSSGQHHNYGWTFRGSESWLSIKGSSTFDTNDYNFYSGGGPFTMTRQ